MKKTVYEEAAPPVDPVSCEVLQYIVVFLELAVF